METYPVPIVICSASWNPEEVDKTFRTMEAGAVAALEKPRGMGHPDSEASVTELLKTVKLMAGVKVVRRWSHDRKKSVPKKDKERKVTQEKISASKDIKLIAMGSSTGGPLVLQTIISGMPKEYPIPIVIVQHIAPGFLAGLAEWLSRTTGYSVNIAEDGERLKPGCAYLAPDGYQLGIDKSLKVHLNDEQPKQNLCPSVSYFFKSVAKTLGKQSIGVLLTGMGKDGADELKLLKELGAITIAQDKETSVVHGMPGEAIKIGGASIVLPSTQIAEKLVNLTIKTENVES